MSKEILKKGCGVNVAIKLFQDEELTLAQAAQSVKMSVETFLERLSALGIDVVGQSEADILEDLQTLHLNL
jgi:predicted HTH domain antitoxin